MAEVRKLEDLDPTALAGHEAWEAEKNYPLWRVDIEGDEVEYTPRPDPSGKDFVQKDMQVDGRTITVWVSKTGKPVMRKAYGRVYLRAVNEDYARAKALSDNPGYHTVLEAEMVESGKK